MQVYLDFAVHACLRVGLFIKYGLNYKSGPETPNSAVELSIGTNTPKLVFYVLAALIIAVLPAIYFFITKKRLLN